MNFTNTDCVRHEIRWQVENQVHHQLLRYLVYDEVSWQMYEQIEPIKTKIEQELNI